MRARTSVTEKMASTAHFFPADRHPPRKEGEHRFTPNRAKNFTCKYRPCHRCDSCLVAFSLIHRAARNRHSPLSVGVQRLGDDSTSRGKLCRFFRLTWLAKSVTFPL